jgi:hypothetical protein
MATGRFRIDIDGDPFLLRSAVFRHLRADPRFDVVLVGSADEPGSADVVAHAQSPAAPPPTPLVLTVATEGPLSLRRTEGGVPRSIVYENLQLLAETLAHELSMPASTIQTRLTDHA